ncbi:NAD(P)-binding protein [Calocera viscosa TUFC12733]|uniref:NAD(P)-binding protein n=1 Tax=Calocera viscosa (strain TUFC12733) TaxID=1330018 RepID=A0A167I7K5_CALVF|nr:NAD(P)-binding protein [Calocera viscosa TUFC12733]
MAPTVYLVSGANRGIGLALVTQLVGREDTVIFAGTRSPSAAKDLEALKSKYPGKVHIVKLTSGSKTDNDAAVATIKAIAGRLDIVIANAGVSSSYDNSDDVSLDALREHFEINVVGRLALFQAAYPLLKASTENPKFVNISSQLGSVQIGSRIPFPTVAYGTSKAALNWLTAKLYHDHPGLIALPIHPGLVKTDMAAEAIAREPAFAHVPMIAPEESAKGILNVVHAAIRNEDGPKLTAFDGRIIPW